MRKKMIFLLFVGMFLTVNLLLPYQARACSCFLPYTWAESQQAEAIFLGTVTDIQYLPPTPIMSSGDPITYTFQVHMVYKEGELSPVHVQSARETDSCGAGLRIGETYVVYAFRYQERALLWVTLCSHTHPADTLSPFRYDILMLIQDLRGKLGLKVQSPDTIYWTN